MFNTKKFEKVNKRLDNTVNKRFALYIAKVLGLDFDANNDSYKENFNGRNVLKEISTYKAEITGLQSAYDKRLASIEKALGTIRILEQKVSLLEDALGLQWTRQEAQPAKVGYVKVSEPKIPKVKKTKK